MSRSNIHAQRKCQSNWTSSDTWSFWMCLNTSFFPFLCATGFIAILTTLRFHKSDDFSCRKVAIWRFRIPSEVEIEEFWKAFSWFFQAPLPKGIPMHFDGSRSRKNHHKDRRKIDDFHLSKMSGFCSRNRLLFCSPNPRFSIALCGTGIQDDFTPQIQAKSDISSDSKLL